MGPIVVPPPPGPITFHVLLSGFCAEQASVARTSRMGMKAKRAFHAMLVAQWPALASAYRRTTLTTSDRRRRGRLGTLRLKCMDRRPLSGAARPAC